MVLALLLLLVITLIGISALNTSTYDLIISGNHRASEEAFYAAEAGIQDGIRRLVKKIISDTGFEDQAKWNVGTTYSSNGFNNTFTAEHLSVGSPLKAAKAPNGKPYYLVRSTGTAGSARSTLEALIFLKSNLNFNYALTGCDKVDLKNAVIIDSYNSKNGTYGGQKGGVSTMSPNGNLYACCATSIHGDVDVTGNYIPSDISAKVSGTIRAGMAPSPCDPLDVKTFVDKADPFPGSTHPDYVLSPAEKRTLSASSGPFKVRDFELGPASTLTVSGSGPVTLYVDGNFTIDSAATLNIEKGTNLTIYVKGDFILSNGSKIQNKNVNDPSSLQVYQSAEEGKAEIDMSDASTFIGTIYAPLSNVGILNASEFYGAIIAKTVTIKNALRLHYDEALGAGSGAGKGYQLVFWRQVFND